MELILTILWHPVHQRSHRVHCRRRYLVLRSYNFGFGYRLCGGSLIHREHFWVLRRRVGDRWYRLRHPVSFHDCFLWSRVDLLLGSYCCRYSLDREVWHWYLWSHYLRNILRSLHRWAWCGTSRYSSSDQRITGAWSAGRLRVWLIRGAQDWVWWVMHGVQIPWWQSQTPVSGDRQSKERYLVRSDEYITERWGGLSDGFRYKIRSFS